MRSILILLALAFTASLATAAQPIRNGYVNAPPSGWSAFLAIGWAETHNKNGNTLMFPPRCVSSCAIAWNFAKRKCVINHDDVMLEQHEFSANGDKINVKSRDKQYWLSLGRQGQPSWDMVRWYENGKKCPSAEANKRSGPPLLRPRIY